MYKFLVWHVLIVGTSCELFAPDNGYLVEYAPKYHDYRPRDYHFNYAVSDPHTGDHKSQWEVKENGVVRGGYSLLEPDGTTRIVEYVADDHGFRAVVKKLGTAVHPEPLVSVVPDVAHYRAYDGQVTNYANVAASPLLYQLQQSLGDQETILQQPQAFGTIQAVPQPISTVQAVPQPISPVQEVSQPIRPVQAIPQSISTVQAVSQPVIPIGHSYSYEQNFGRIDGNLEQIQETNPILTSQVVQGQTLGTINAVPLAEKPGVGRIETDLSRIETLPANVETIPLLQGQQGIEGLPITEAQWRRIEADIGGIEEAPLQGHDIAEIEANLRRIETVPLLQEPNIGRIEVVPVQRQDLGRVEVGSFGQAQNLGRSEGGWGRIEAVPVQNYDERRVDVVRLPQPQIEIHAARPLPENIDNNIGQGPGSGVVPIGPSGTYTTNIEYHGLTGNPEDDSRYTQERKEVYHASYSQKVAKMVPPPNKREKLSKKEFLIYYPDSESH